MRQHSSSVRRSWCLVFAASSLCLGLAACASSLREPPIAATPQQIPTLRAFFRNDTGNVAMRMRLAEAERSAGQLTEASALLEPVADNIPVAGFYLGLVREDQGRVADARRLYERYLARRPGGVLGDRLRQHLEELAQQRADGATTQSRAAALTTTDLARFADSRISTDRLASLQAANPFQAIERLVPDPLVRDASAEAFGAEGFGRSGEADIVIQRPAGTGTGSSAVRGRP